MIILPDPLYNPNFQSISSNMKLGPGITLAKFLGAPGSRIQLQRIKADKKQMARNLYLHAEIMRAAINNKQFKEHRIIVSEGVYIPAEFEAVVPTDVNFYRQNGQAVVYQCIGKDGEVDHTKTFDLAVYWKDYVGYEKLILDYDTYDPSGKLSSQIVVVVPAAPETWDVSYKRDVETVFNQKLMSKNELVEFGI